MSLYAEYIKERSNDSIIEIPEGFVTYRYTDDETTVYIVNIYVLPEFRRSKVCFMMADKIIEEAKARGCTYLIGSVVPSANNSTTSLEVLIAYGMKLHSSTNDFIVFRKEI